MRDILFRSTTVEHYDRALRFSRTYADRCEHLVDSEPASWPSSAQAVFDDTERAHFTRIVVGPCTIILFYFYQDELEATIDPREVTDERSFQATLNYFRGLGETMNLNGCITEESSPDHRWFTFDRKAGRVTFNRLY